MEFKNDELVGMYVLTEDGCDKDEQTPIGLQDNYFNDRLITKSHGRYYEKTRAICIDRLKSTGVKKLLFRYKGYCVACAMIVDNKFFYGKDEKRKDDFKNYIQLDIDTIKTFPIFSFNDAKDDIFYKYDSSNELLSKGQHGNGNGAVFKVKNATLLNNYINKEYDDNPVEIKEIKEFFDKYETTCLLREISYFNNEDAHSFFLANFIKEDNSFGLGKKSFISFLKMIGEDYKNIDDITIYPQKQFKIIKNNIVSVKSARPDITITYSCNNIKKMIILEAKMNAFENIYNVIDKPSKKIYQLDLYHDFLAIPDNMKDYKLSKIVMLVVDKKDCRNKNYIKYIDYQDIIDYIYEPMVNSVLYNKRVLEDYLKSFWFTVDANEFYNFNISLIPKTSLYIGSDNMFKSIESQIKKWITNKKIPKITDDNKRLMLKYILSLMYKNMNYKDMKKDIKEVYSSL